MTHVLGGRVAVAPIAMNRDDGRADRRIRPQCWTLIRIAGRHEVCPTAWIIMVFGVGMRHTDGVRSGS